ncbi:YbgA family protein [Spirochaeta cellobiosiphila]|uniref:YbgA family protein n=1 Tax=Spirochaeta cellobiosiphila TaxID=504483 RepID=UPI00040065F9|nr:DUF523 and DUF1722 domain-containing protein [Spirochaeta cellobiosiphila]
MDKIKIGISSCLLGNQVRYDGQHKWDRYITETLSQWFDFVPVCPEVECGMTIPRESMRLVGDPENPLLLTGKTKLDKTEQMQSWIPGKLDQLAQSDIVGFIFKSKSPSSGFYNVKVYNEEGVTISHKGQGLFAKAFARRFPDIPVEEEGRLHDPGLRERFIEALFTMQDWRKHVKGKKARDLVDFHSRHKYTFMAHSPSLLKEMGALVASLGQKDLDSLRSEYLALLVKMVGEQKSLNNNYNVLLHMLGYFKKKISPEEKQELLQVCDQYHKGYVPLVVPLTLIRHYSLIYKEEYLLSQRFLNPHPIELGLLNHV